MKEQKIKPSTEIAEDDLKVLRDLARREVVVNYGAIVPHLKQQEVHRNALDSS